MSSTGLQIAAERLLDLELTYDQLRDLVRLVVADPRLFDATRHALRTRRQESVAASQRLLACADTEDVDGVRLALAAGADPDARTVYGSTALHVASYGTCSRVDIVALLLRAGADPNVRDGRNFTPVDTAAIMQRADLVKCLLDGGAAPTSLELATSYGNLEIMKMLLDAGADPNERNSAFANNTPLYMAATLTEREDAAAKMLLEHGANPNVQNDAGATPLHTAVYGRRRTVELLLRAGADPTIRDMRGEMPGKRYTQPDIVALLRAYGGGTK